MRTSSTTMPVSLKRPSPEIADTGTIRLGDMNVSAEFPRVKRPSPEIADRGTVRLGDMNVSAEFST